MTNQPAIAFRCIVAINDRMQSAFTQYKVKFDRNFEVMYTTEYSVVFLDLATVICIFTVLLPYTTIQYSYDS